MFHYGKLGGPLAVPQCGHHGIRFPGSGRPLRIPVISVRRAGRIPVYKMRRIHSKIMAIQS